MKIFLISVLLISYNLTIAQNPMGGSRNGGGQTMNGHFYGKILESKTNKPIAYASVELLQNKFDTVSRKRKEVVINGMITENNGEFSLDNLPIMGQFKLRITVVGFKPLEKTVAFNLKAPTGNDMSAMLNMTDKDLGNIKMDVEENTLSNVTVTASKPGLVLGIDRKVFNVDKNLVSVGGTAVDIMKNVPSINVDIDGNVTMRNSTPQIFVDGRPTTLTLDQIPADNIESIELITNPSAKFDASGGTAGILNIVLKKNKKVGYNGGIRASIDSRAKVGLGADANLRQQKVNLFLSANYMQRKSISQGTTNRLTYGTPNSNLLQTDSSTMNGEFQFYRGGFDYFLNNRNTISLAGNIMHGEFKPYTNSQLFTDYLFNPTVSTFGTRFSNTVGIFNNRGGTISYKHNFPKAGEELSADFNYNEGKNENKTNLSSNLYSLPGNIYKGNFGQLQVAHGINEFITSQTDYVKPLTEFSKIEMGLRVQIRNMNSSNLFYQNIQDIPYYISSLSVKYNSTDKVYAAYTTYSNKVKNFGYQLGLRAESSNYMGNLPDSNLSFKTKYPISLFPSVNLSEKLKQDQELQFSYTRKINRPNFFQLFPFTDYSDTLNISRGNPSLKPEFTNSAELTYQKTFKNTDNFIASIYYKRTENLIARYQISDSNLYNHKAMLVNTYINANNAYVTGVEFISKNKINSWWDITSNLNLFTSKINAGLPGFTSSDQFISWFGKMNNSFKFPKNFTLQLSGDYQSKTVLPPGGSSSSGGGGRGMMGGGGGGMFSQTNTAQGYIKANYGIDAALKYDFLKNKAASISLNVNDIFRTKRSDVYSQSPSFVQEVIRRRDPQVFRLNFNWRFGKFDPNLFKRKNTKGGDSGMDSGMQMGG